MRALRVHDKSPLPREGGGAPAPGVAPYASYRSVFTQSECASLRLTGRAMRAPTDYRTRICIIYILRRFIPLFVVILEPVLNRLIEPAHVRPFGLAPARLFELVLARPIGLVYYHIRLQLLF